MDLSIRYFRVINKSKNKVMLVKLNTKDKKGRDLYKNALSGRVALLSGQEFRPSQRRDNRINAGISKTVSSTKRTKNGIKTMQKLGIFLGSILDRREKAKKSK